MIFQTENLALDYYEDMYKRLNCPGKLIEAINKVMLGWKEGGRKES